jgi:hypothetical protein
VWLSPVLAGRRLASYRSVVGDETSMCPGCHKSTPTVLGKCPNCWYVKQSSAAPARRRYKPLWFDWDENDVFDFVWFWVWWSPGAVALVLGLLLDVPALIVVGGSLLALRLLGPTIADWLS